MKTPVTIRQVQDVIRSFLRAERAMLDRIEVVVGISRGGLVPAALVAMTLDRPLIAAYIDRQDRVYLDRGAWLRGRRVLIVDDIVRTGATLSRINALIRRSRPAMVRTFSLFTLNGATVQPDWTRYVATDRKMPWDRPRRK